MSLEMNKIQSLLKKSTEGILAVVDQGIFSGSNFVITILLARYLPSYDFGAFSLSYSIIVVFQQLHSAILLEPISVFGSTYKGLKKKKYLNSQAKLHFLITAIWGALFLAVLLLLKIFIKDSAVLNLLVLWCLLLPIYLLIFFTRRIFYILKKPALAMTSSVLYTITMFLGVAYFIQKNILDATTGIVVVVVPSFFGSLLLYSWIKQPEKDAAFSIKALFQENLTIGKWLVLSGVFIALANQTQIYLSSSIIGVEAAGVLRALQSFTQPMTLTVVAISSYTLPIISRDFLNYDKVSGRKKALLISLILIILSLVFEMILIFWNTEIEGLFFQGRYSQFVYLMPILGIAPIISAAYSGFSNILMAIKQPKALLVASLIWITVNLSVGTIIIMQYGILGAVISIIIGHLSLLFSFYFLYRKWYNNYPQNLSI